MSREVLILIPGLKQASVYNQRSRLVAGIKHVWEGPVLTEVQGGPADAVRLAGPGGHPVIDVYEAYWNDLVPSLSGEGLPRRVLRGLSLTGYWGASSLWKGIGSRWRLTIGTMTSGLVLVLWYVSVVALFYDAVAANPGFLAGLPVVGAAIASWDPAGLWWVWAALSILALVVPVTILVDMMDFAKIYASEEVLAEDDVALRFQIVSRVREQINHALDGGPCHRLTVVGHSFGAVVAVDVMSHLRLPHGLPFRLVTLGSPAELLSHKARWLDDDIQACADRTDLTEWIDIVSTGDWLATGTPAKPGRLREMTVRSHGTLVDRIVARVHGRYLDNQQTLNEILRPDALAAPEEVHS
jgi:hypothetical protein